MFWRISLSALLFVGDLRRLLTFTACCSRLLFSLWATLVSSTLIFTFANKTMPMAQKLIHARLVAQGGALTGFVGLAAFGIQGRKESEEDRLNRRIYEHVLDSHDGSGLEGVKAIETETPWQRAERWCARAKLDYEKCVSENPARGCIEKEDNLLQCLGGKVAGQTFKTWMTCHRSIRSVGSYEGRTDCEAYRALLKEAIELARDR